MDNENLFVCLGGLGLLLFENQRGGSGNATILGKCHILSTEHQTMNHLDVPPHGRSGISLWAPLMTVF